jgi:hypothetical protein
MVQTRVPLRRRSRPESRDALALPPEHALLALQRGAGNRAVTRMLQRRIDGRVPLERFEQLRQTGIKKATVQQGQQSTIDQSQLPWYLDLLETVLADMRKLARSIRAYNFAERDDQQVAAKNLLRQIVDQLQELQVKVEYEVKDVAGGYRDQDSVELYRAAVGVNADLIGLATVVNDEVARRSGVQRAGAGGRPDANQEAAMDASINLLGLSPVELAFVTNFVAGHRGNWKQRREALSAVWALRQGMFANLTTAKVGGQSIAPGGLDVEYLTTDPGTSQMWDQKTIYTDQSGFKGRVDETHSKGTDPQGRGIGILLDSTFEGTDNYEKIWLGFSQMLLDGRLPGSALKEVVAPQPQNFRAAIHVDMTVHASANASPEEKNIRWAENRLTGQQDANGLQCIAPASLAGTGLNQARAGTGNSWSRYRNDRNWLPAEPYSEYAVEGVIPNPGKARFVVTDDTREGRRKVYLSVTHYKGFTVNTANGMVSRNAFYRVM